MEKIRWPLDKMFKKSQKPFEHPLTLITFLHDPHFCQRPSSKKKIETKEWEPNGTSMKTLMPFRGCKNQ